jgi:coenzyme F420-0:L-glutamate ligase/coenzyme F420-1:gamma-L-glutamate ligase
MLSDLERRFVTDRRIGHLATADASGVPHVLPVCFVFSSKLYITIDDKTKKRALRPLKRLRNIAENPAVAVVFDRYDDDWGLLGWVMIRGQARILTDGTEHDEAQALLRSRYPQLREMQLAKLPVIAIEIEKCTSWGNLSPAEEG